MTFDVREQSTIPISRRRLIHCTAAAGAASAALGLSRTSATSAAGGLSPLTSADKRTLTIATFDSPAHLDPHLAYEYQSTMAILGAYEGLIGLKDGATDEYEGLIAERWESNADQSVWTFHLRAGVTFQDGSPVDAEAVRASFERFLTLDTPSTNVIKRFFTDPSQITTPDPATVIFSLGKPQPLFEAAIAATYGPEIVNAREMKRHEENGDRGQAWADLHEDGCGSGPYRIVNFQPGDVVELERYDGYWRGWNNDNFDRIVIRVVPEEGTRRLLIEQGGVDIVDNLTPRAVQALRNNPEVVVDERLSTQVQYFMMAVTGPLAKPEARQALGYAFPYENVVSGVYEGHAERAFSAVAERTRGFDADTPRFNTDLDFAKTLLRKAEIADGTKLRIAITNGDTEVTSTAELFQENLTKLGFDVSIESTDVPTHVSLLYGSTPVEQRPHLMWWGWWPDYNDAWDHLFPQVACAAQSPNGANAGFYCKPEVDALLDQARDATNDQDYEEAISRVQEIVSFEDPAAIYYLQPQWTTVLRKDVTGFVFNPINIGTYNFWKLRRRP